MGYRGRFIMCLFGGTFRQATIAAGGEQGMPKPWTMEAGEQRRRLDVADQSSSWLSGSLPDLPHAHRFLRGGECEKRIRERIAL